MEKILFLCVDLGTSFIKTGIYDIDGNCLIEQKEAVIDEKPQPGIVIQRGEKLFASVLRCIKRTVSAAGTRGAVDIQAICFTGQMAGFIGVDKDWNDITTWSCFIDRRYVPYADRQMAKYSELFLNISGTHSPLMAPKIEWFATEYPQEARKIVKYMMISSYVIGKLGNMPIEEAVMDHSFLSWTGLGDIRKGTWSDQICGLIGMDQLYLPRIAKSNEICAYLSKDMAGELGLKSGIPLVSGAGDKVAGSVGAAVLDFGDAIFEAGTYGAISVLVRDFRMNRGADYYDIVPAAVDNYYAHKYIPGSGMTLDWFIQTFCPDMSVEEAFAYMEEKVPQIAPGCEGLSAVGLLGGSAMPFNGTVRGLFRGYTWSHKREHLHVLKSNDSEGNRTWGLITPPGGGYSNGGTAYGIPQSLDEHQKELAWAWIKYITMSEEGCTNFYEAHTTPTLYKPMYDLPLYEGEPDEFFGGQNIMAKYIEIAKNPKTQARQVTKYDAAIDHACGEIVVQMAEGYINAEEAYQRLVDATVAAAPELAE